jgi:hypothetical protein
VFGKFIGFAPHHIEGIENYSDIFRLVQKKVGSRTLEAALVAGHLAAIASRPLPPHSSQGAGNILRPGWTGCLTFGSPVPLHAEHFASGNLSLALNFFMKHPPKRKLIPLATERQQLWCV